MTIDSFEVLFYTAIFLLPGFVINCIIDKTTPPQKHNDTKFIFKCIMFSIISCAIWSWLYLIIIRCDSLNAFIKWLLLILVSLLCSSLIGIVFAFVKQKQFVAKVLSRCQLKTSHSVPTAWDYIFSEQNEMFVIITLKDDKQIFGWYSTNSFTSSDPDERDMFVEKIYDYNDGEWLVDDYNQGCYISKDQIKFIEFKKGAEENG